MAVKTYTKTFPKERGHHKRTQGTPFSDEIALRDEILELKRQVARLKRTNEQNLVKFRKYEDEAKRKDRQIEQLMDPRKNAEVTKLLSTKGAAILMTLKDQNNSLIQMILNKDLQIRKLVSEIKMSKLYASSKKNEPFRTEVNRLRNLLVRSQEMLKENVDHHQSMCFSENPLLEMSSSSEQSSPRDLDELRSTIQSLETHIKYSNELLAKKNQEISILTDELNTLRKFFHCKLAKKKPKNVFDFEDFFDQHEIPPKQWAETSELFPQETEMELFRKPVTNSAPTSASKRLPSTNSTPEHRSSDKFWRETGKIEKTEWDINDKDSVVGSVKEEKVVSREKIKEKWKKALEKYKESKSKNSGNVGEETQGEKVVGKNEASDLETYEFEMMEKEIQNDRMESEKISKSGEIKYCNAITEAELKGKQNITEIHLRTKRENSFEGNMLSPNSETHEFSPNETPKPEDEVRVPRDLCQNPESSETFEITEVDSNDEMQLIKKEIHKITPTYSPEIQKELIDLYQNISNYQEIETKRVKSLRETYRQSLDSSFESENGYVEKEVHHVEVEVEINSGMNDSDSVHSQTFQCSENGENSAPFDDFNDDDDVIVR